MDGGKQKYDFGALDGLADGIDTRVKAIQDRLDNLRSKVDGVTAIWEGSANEGFRATQQKWRTSADDLTQVLNQIAVAVKRTNADAQATEHTNKGRW